MTHYQIVSRVSSESLGVYEGEDKAGALDAMARDAGYRDYAHCREETGGDEEELIVTEAMGTKTAATITSVKGTKRGTIRECLAWQADLYGAYPVITVDGVEIDLDDIEIDEEDLNAAVGIVEEALRAARHADEE